MRFEWLAVIALGTTISACSGTPDDDPMTPASEASGAPTAGSPMPAATDRDAIQRWVLSNYGGEGRVGYQSSEFDLDGDGTPEVLAYIAGPNWCGTGGCTLVVAKRDGDNLTEVLRTSVTQLPVGVLDSSTNGWRDLWVSTAGGGELTGRRKLMYDGQSYPTNPTVPPAEKLHILDAQPLIEDGDLIWLN